MVAIGAAIMGEPKQPQLGKSIGNLSWQAEMTHV